MGKPKELSDFVLYEHDKIKIYCSKVVDSKNSEINLKLSRYFGIKHLSVGRIRT